MPSLAPRLFSLLVSSLSLHRMVLQALEDDLEIHRLAERLYESRKPVMTILCALFGCYVSIGQFTSASWVTTVILLTFGISSLYDGQDVATLRNRIRAIHPIVFTILNAIPNVAIGMLLVVEIIFYAQSTSVILVQALLIALPLLYQILRDLWALNLDE